MSHKTPPHIIEEIRRATAAGEMRKYIAKRLGVSALTVTTYAKGVPKPFDYRGIKGRVGYRQRYLATGLTHREDLEDL